jgi:hypothetical protein
MPKITWSKWILKIIKDSRYINKEQYRFRILGITRQQWKAKKWVSFNNRTKRNRNKKEIIRIRR